MGVSLFVSVGGKEVLLSKGSMRIGLSPDECLELFKDLASLLGVKLEAEKETEQVGVESQEAAEEVVPVEMTVPGTMPKKVIKEEVVVEEEERVVEDEGEEVVDHVSQDLPEKQVKQSIVKPSIKERLLGKMKKGV